MLLRWLTYRSPLNAAAQAAIEELQHRFRALDGLPVILIVVEAGKTASFDLTVICRSRKSLTWVWLAYDAMTEEKRNLISIQPFTLAEAKQDVVLLDLLRIHMNGKAASDEAKSRRAQRRSLTSLRSLQ